MGEFVERAQRGFDPVGIYYFSKRYVKFLLRSLIVEAFGIISP
jgi:hypothetical protein